MVLAFIYNFSVVQTSATMLRVVEYTLYDTHFSADIKCPGYNYCDIYVYIYISRWNALQLTLLHEFDWSTLYQDVYIIIHLISMLSLLLYFICIFRLI